MAKPKAARSGQGGSDRPTRKPMLVVYDDYTAEISGWRGETETFDLLTPIDFNTHIVPVSRPSLYQEITDPLAGLKLDYYREGEVSFSLRERLKPPPAPPYNTVDLPVLKVQMLDRKIEEAGGL